MKQNATKEINSYDGKVWLLDPDIAATVTPREWGDWTYVFLLWTLYEYSGL